MDGFSAHFDPCGFILDDFYLSSFPFIFYGLTLFPEGPEPSEAALKVQGPSETDVASGRSQDPVAVS